MKTDRLMTVHQALGYRAYCQQNNLYINKNSVGCVFEGVPLVGIDPDTLTLLTRLLGDGLPAEAVLQCTLLGSPAIGAAIDPWVAARASHLALASISQKRRDFFARAALTPPVATEPGLFMDQVVVLSVTVQNTTAAIAALQTVKEDILALADSVGLPLTPMLPERLLSRVWYGLYPTGAWHYPTIDWHKHQSLAEHLIEPSEHIQITPEALHFTQRDWQVKTYTVRQFPERWDCNAMNEVLGDRFDAKKRVNAPLAWQLTVKAVDPEFSKRRALVKSTRWQKLAHSALGWCVPRARQVAQEWHEVHQRCDAGERLVLVHCQAMVMAPRADFLKVTRQFETFMEQQRWHLADNRYLHYPHWLSFLPMHAVDFWEDFSRLGRLHTVLSEHAASLLPLQGDHKGGQSPCVLLTSRRGQVAWWDPFDNVNGNYNTAIIGKSRSGKSVFMQELASGVVGMGGQVFILDLGRSFEKACHYLGGTFIEFSRDKPLCLNPFTAIRSFEHTLVMLKPVIAAMAAPRSTLGDLEGSLLEQALTSTWQTHGNASTITEVAAWLNAHHDPRAHDLGTMLYPYTKSGMYGDLFEGDCALDLSNPYCVLELEELKGQRDLQTVVLMLLIYHITETLVTGDRTVRKLVVIDEAWDLLNGELGGQFIEMGCRRAAKYNGAFVTATQSLRDYYKSPAALAALENSDWTVFFAERAGGVESTNDDKQPALSPYLQRCLKSLTTVRGQYAECVIQGARGYALYRLWLDPFSRILYSSTGEEYAAVKAAMARGQSLEAAVSEVARLRHGEADHDAKN
jgi:conjugal transfer ATP-binding protein TraC